LRDLGYVEGHDLALDFRFADGVVDRLPALAAELVAQKPQVIVAGSMPAIVAARNATRTIPIIMSAIVQDPMAAGLAVTMGRPGGNISGFWSGDEGLMGKRLELLKDAVPGISRVGILLDMSDADAVNLIAALPATAQGLGLRPVLLEVRSAADLEAALIVIGRESLQGLYVNQSPLFFARRAEVAAVATRARLALVSGYREFAAAGALLSYAPNLPDVYRRAAAFVDKVLKGMNVGDLPIERPVKFELVANLRTAKALGLKIPESFLVRVDEVIE
jgi:putative tryptophan/tyrosine transport system substrate-binding protein